MDQQTVTGVAVGGLRDGIVDADMIAAAAVGGKFGHSIASSGANFKMMLIQHHNG